MCSDLCENGSYHILSVGGGGMLTTRVPESSCTSTASSRGVLDISSIFFFMYSFSVAFWKYFDLAILSTNFKIRLLVLPPAAALWEAKSIFHLVALIYFRQHLLSHRRHRDCVFRYDSSQNDVAHHPFGRERGLEGSFLYIETITINGWPASTFRNHVWKILKITPVQIDPRYVTNK